MLELPKLKIAKIAKIENCQNRKLSKSKIEVINYAWGEVPSFLLKLVHVFGTIFWDIILGWHYDILGWKFINIYFFSWQTDKNLFQNYKKFVIWKIFVQNIVISSQNNHPFNMKRFLIFHCPSGGLSQRFLNRCMVH